MIFYTKKIENLKSFVSNEIISILKNPKFILIEKQKKLEKFLFVNLKKFIYVRKNNVYYETIAKLKESLDNIDFSQQVGKTYFKKFFKIINEIDLKKIILENFLIYINYYKNCSGNFLLYNLIYVFNDYLTINQLEKYEDLIYKVSAYIIENLKINKIIYYHKILNTYKLYSLNFKLLEVSVIKNVFWPLVTEPNYYKFQEKKGQILGGYYIYPLNIIKEKNFIQKIEIKDNLINLINKYQKFSFKLLENKNSLKLLKKYYLYLENFIEKKKEKLEQDFLTNKFIKKGYEKFYQYFDIQMQDWYVLYQFFTFKESNIENIYFSYQLDFRGRVYNSLNYGLNITFNKLSRCLVNQGLYKIEENHKNYIKQYICKYLEINTEEEFDNFVIYVKNLIINNFENIQINFEKIIGIVLICDWIDNVCINNETEILIELDASQSGFQMLSLFANDYKGLLHTNIIDEGIRYDLYNIILKKFFDKLKGLNKNWIKIVDRHFIKKIIMTIPYGSTLLGQVKMLLNEFRLKYDLHYLFENEKDVNILIESNIILEDDSLQKSLMDFFNEIKNKKIEDISDIGIKLNTFQKEIEFNLKSHFFVIIHNLINDILKEEYINIIYFIERIKETIIKRNVFIKNNMNLNNFETEYVNYYLTYYKYEKIKTDINGSEYERYVLNKFKIDYKQSVQGFIANLCHGLGDSFIIHKFIEKCIQDENLKFITIHDSVIVKVVNIVEIQKNINFSYNYIYDYIFEKKYFLDIIENKEKYVLNSFNIFKI